MIRDLTFLRTIVSCMQTKILEIVIQYLTTAALTLFNLIVSINLLNVLVG